MYTLGPSSFQQAVPAALKAIRIKDLERKVKIVPESFFIHCGCMLTDNEAFASPSSPLFVSNE